MQATDPSSNDHFVVSHTQQIVKHKLRTYRDILGGRMIRQPLQVHFDLVNGPLHIFQFLQTENFESQSQHLK